jgi:ubiquinone/menaquinone biosynthesis C-methylase UbiE
MNTYSMKAAGTLATRSWCRENANIIRYLLQFKELGQTGTRFWEYPFVFKHVMSRPKSKILDIGIGEGIFATILENSGHEVLGVDNYESCWTDHERIMKNTGIKVMNQDARDLSVFPDCSFDITILLSVIEHIPSNTIFCEKRRVIKTGQMLDEEIPDKRRVISEALRVLRPGGLLIITSDIYLDYPPEMNISWRKLIGLAGVGREDITDHNDLFFSDNPIHKGRVLPMGVLISKEYDRSGEELTPKAHLESQTSGEEFTPEARNESQTLEIKEWYDKKYKSKGVNAYRQYHSYRPIVDILQLQSGERFLDVGCGQGYVLKWALQQTNYGYGIDLSTEALKIASQTVPTALLSLSQGESLPFHSECFDKINCGGVLEHFQSIEQGLVEFYRVLKPGGIAVIIVPNSNFKFWTEDQKGTSQQEIRETLKDRNEWRDLINNAGLRIIDVKMDNFIAPQPHRLSTWECYQFVFICCKGQMVQEEYFHQRLGSPTQDTMAMLKQLLQNGQIQSAFSMANQLAGLYPEDKGVLDIVSRFS